MQTNRVWAGAIGLIILALIGVAFLQQPGLVPSSTNATSTTETNTTTHDGVTGTGGFTVSGDDVVDLKIPDFHAPIQFSSSVQADVKTALQKAADTLASRLTTNSLDLRSWIDLGTVRKMAGDYAGAEKAWTFVTQAAPKNSIAYNNLGDLYENFVKNYQKAEQAYLTAIKLSPKDESPYINLYTMYAHMYKQGTSAAEDILKKGTAAIPDSVALHVQLARYYKDKGDQASAKIQYDAAIAAAKASGQTAIVDQLQKEKGQ